MERRNIAGTLIINLALISLFFGSVVAPRLLVALPTRYQLLLPASIYAAIHTPLPKTLPTPIPLMTAAVRAEARKTDFDMQSPGIPTSSFSSDGHQQEIPNQIPSTEKSNRPRLTPDSDELALMKIAPNEALISGIEIVPQKFNNCGPANLSIVLNYYGVLDNQVEIGDQLKPNYEDRNVSPEELVRYVNEGTALKAAVLRGGDISILRLVLSAGYPVIIEKGLMLDRREGWMGHYLTLTGYNDSEAVFIGQDTFLGPWDSSGREIGYQKIAEEWHHFNNAFIVITPANEFEKIMDILPATFSDSKSMWEQAVKKSRRFVKEDSSNPYSWFNLGSSLSHLGLETGEFDNFSLAADAFDQARRIGLPWRMLWYQFEPYEAYLAAGRIDDVMLLTEAILIYEGGRNIEETYLYRGHAQFASGDLEAAKLAYQKALDLNPAFHEARHALELLEGSK